MSIGMFLNLSQARKIDVPIKNVVDIIFHINLDRNGKVILQRLAF